MIRNKAAIVPNERVDLAIMMDGFGGPALKIRNTNATSADEPIEYAGIKLFYKHDRPLIVAAASTTSQTSMPMRSVSCASSLTSAMLTAR